MLFADTLYRFDCLHLSEAVGRAAVNAAGIPDVTPATRRWLDYSIRQLLEAVGDLRVDELSAQLLFDWHQSVCGRASAVTANSYLRGVNTVLARLTQAGYLAANPGKSVPYAKEPTKRPKAVSEATYLAMRAAADNARDRAIIDILYATGCRLAGLCSMTVAGLELWTGPKGDWRMAVEVAEKFGKRRFVYAGEPQSTSVRAWLAERPPAPHDYLFVSLGDRSYGKPLQPTGVQSLLRGLREKAAIKRGVASNAHGFRHAFAIRMLDSGHDIAAVAAWLGHSDPAFTAAVYCNRREDQLRAKFFGD